jgi:hypothetical protein
MFKHKIYLLILALAVFASCKKEDDLGDVSGTRANWILIKRLRRPVKKK